MDRFKFRVFSLRENKYLDIPIYVTQNGNLVDKTLEKDWFDGGYVREIATGKKDKNGKLIYEGDIVQIMFDEDGIAGPYSVVWDCEDYAFMFKPTEKDDDGDYYDCDRYLYEFSVNRIQIIGNIHENSELLEVNND